MSTRRQPVGPWFAALAAAVVIVAIIVGLPIVLVAVGANPVPSSVPSVPSMQSVWESLTRQDDGTLVLAVIKVVAWLAWLFLTVSLLVEVVSQLRGVRAPRLPGLQVPQAAARGLVAAAILLFVGAPVVASLLGRPTRHPLPVRPASRRRRHRHPSVRAEPSATTRGSRPRAVRTPLTPTLRRRRGARRRLLSCRSPPRGTSCSPGRACGRSRRRTWVTGPGIGRSPR